MIPRYRGWLEKARDLASRRGDHEDSLRRVRQETYLQQVVAGLVEEGEGTEPLWEQADPELRYRFQTFQRLIGGLDELDVLIQDVEARREVASTIWQRSIGRECLLASRRLKHMALEHRSVISWHGIFTAMEAKQPSDLVISKEAVGEMKVVDPRPRRSFFRAHT